MITQKELKKLLTYNKKTGIFKWKVNRGKVKKGDIAGCKNSRGYILIQTNGILFRAHRLIWFYVYGYWPKQIDHINRKKDDNRICNLRECSNYQNQINKRLQKNNKSGYKGVYLYKPTKKWCAELYVNNKKIHLGYFTNKKDAIKIRKLAEKQINN